MNQALTDSGRLTAFVREHPRLVILTGAGVSADSGIPTYRDASGRWLYRKPIQHRDFVRDELTRKRYWSRSVLGWPQVRDAAPNYIHEELAAFETSGSLELLITQNVDRLHQRAGSKSVIDLHGRLDRVRCLDCGAVSEREEIQTRLLALNPGERSAVGGPRPDGDSDAPEENLMRFKVPCCSRCGGVLTPDVVFFGGTIPPARVESCRTALKRADALLVIGSSLEVYSGYRFCRQARDSGKALAIINPGRTRADPIADLKISSDAASVLSELAPSR